MKRKHFLHLVGGTFAMAGLSTLNAWAQLLTPQSVRMPMLFIGHGSPMNAIENNNFTQGWKATAEAMPRPKAIVVISAHWCTRGTWVTAMENPKTIHDFGGFPEVLFQQQYPAKGDPLLASAVVEMLAEQHAQKDQEWGLDHGTWSVLLQMYPKADIPVIQISIDYHQPPAYHFALAGILAELRDKGVLIMASGNMVHNLRMMQLKDQSADFSAPYGFDWALRINETFKNAIASHDYNVLLDYTRLDKDILLAVPTPDHYYPLIYTLGMRKEGDKVRFFNDTAVAGSITMTSVQWSAD